MKLLVIAGHYPFPPRIGSALVAYHQLMQLARAHSIHFVCVDPEATPNGLGLFEKVEIVRPPQRSRWTVWLRMLCGLSPFTQVPGSRKLRKRVAQITTRERFDGIIVYELQALHFCPPPLWSRSVASIEDPQSIRVARLARLPVWSRWQRARLTLHALLLRRYEKAVLPHFGRVLVLSEQDLHDLNAEQGLTNLGQVPYGVAQPATQELRRWEARTPGMIVFSGNMFHPPNVDGILFFLERIFPLVLAEEPAATVWVIGSRPDPRILTAAAQYPQRVVVTGAVDDLSQHLSRACVSICPVRLKIGVQTKVLEALSWATPVVTTSAGNSGVQGCSGRDLWVEDEPQRFAGRVVELLRGQNWAALSSCGRLFVAERFTWQQSAAALERYVSQLQASG